jgi:hypothetical protein
VKLLHGAHPELFYLLFPMDTFLPCGEGSGRWTGSGQAVNPKENGVSLGTK